ncbi:MAG: hypothetical protein WEC39_00500 [Patescibacteria group bacterium]
MKLLKENLIAQIIFVVVVAALLYFAIPWIFDKLGGVFNLYEGSYSPLQRTY